MRKILFLILFMKVLVDDDQSVVGSIIKEYNRLSILDPENKLLDFLSDVTDKSFYLSIGVKKEFDSKYTQGEKSVQDILKNYLGDLRDAVEEVESTQPHDK